MSHTMCFGSGQSLEADSLARAARARTAGTGRCRSSLVVAADGRLPVGEAVMTTSDSSPALRPSRLGFKPIPVDKIGPD